MVSGGMISRISRTVATRCHCQGSLIIRYRHVNQNLIPDPRHFHSFSGSLNKVVASQTGLQNPILNSYTFQRFGISSSASPHSNENETSLNEGETTDNIPNDTKQTMSMEDMVKLIAEKDGLMKINQEQIEEIRDKLLRTYAEMENVKERTNREAENSKKFAIQNFAKSLLDVADNLQRASSVVKRSFAKIDTSEDSAEAMSILKTLLEGVEMTDKQLAEVFKKFGVEKYDPVDEKFDPKRHTAVFKVPDSTKPPDYVAVVLKAGYMLNDQILRLAEVGVTRDVDDEDDDSDDDDDYEMVDVDDCLRKLKRIRNTIRLIKTPRKPKKEKVDVQHGILTSPDEENIKNLDRDPHTTNEEKLDDEDSTLTGPNEEEINNLDCGSHTTNEEELDVEDSTLTSPNEEEINNLGSQTSNDGWGFSFGDFFGSSDHDD